MVFWSSTSTLLLQFCPIIYLVQYICGIFLSLFARHADMQTETMSLSCDIVFVCCVASTDTVGLGHDLDMFGLINIMLIIN